VQEAGAASLGGLREMADSGRIHRERRRRLVLGAIDCCVSRRVDDHVRPKLGDERRDRGFVRDIELLERDRVYLELRRPGHALKLASELTAGAANEHACHGCFTVVRPSRLPS
jgi:hypothetical protein